MYAITTQNESKFSVIGEKDDVIKLADILEKNKIPFIVESIPGCQHTLAPVEVGILKEYEFWEQLYRGL